MVLSRSCAGAACVATTIAAAATRTVDGLGWRVGMAVLVSSGRRSPGRRAAGAGPILGRGARAYPGRRRDATVMPTGASGRTSSPGTSGWRPESENESAGEYDDKSEVFDNSSAA